MPTKKNTTLEEAVQPDESEVSQTETNLETKDRNDSELSGNSGINAQTDLEPESDKGNSPEDAEETAVSGASGQTDTETEKKPGTRRRKTADPVSENNNISPEGPEPAAPRRTRTRSDRASPVLSIDDQRTVETDADKARNDLLDLLESQKSGKILSGTIQGVERADDHNAHSMAVIYHGEYKVIIPAEEAVEPPEDYRGMPPQDVLHYMLTKRLGAEVDYIVKGIDTAENIKPQPAGSKQCAQNGGSITLPQTGTAITLFIQIFVLKHGSSLSYVQVCLWNCSVWRYTSRCGN